MKTLKLYEEYINSGSNRISTLLKNLVNSLNLSFSGENKTLGEKDLESLSLIDIEQSNSNDALEKNILMRFSDYEYHYQMIFVIKLEDVTGNEPIDKGYMKIKIYDSIQATLLREWQSDLSIEESADDDMNKEGRWFLKIGESDGKSKNGLEYIENFIIEKISFMKEMLEKNTL